MDAFVIQGGRRLRGRVRIHGSKNASLPLMAAALLTDEPVTLEDVPDLADIRNMLKLMESLGCEVDISKPAGRLVGANDGQTVRLHATDPSKSLAHYDIVRTMRASICALGPLLAKRGIAKVSMPGGCAIGDRPVDLHLRGMEALGARINLEAGYIIAEAPAGGRLIGRQIFLGGAYGSTVLGTANVMSAATLAEGVTVIESAACEPEVADLARLLNSMGARIRGAGSPRITIEGVDELHGVTHEVIPDRIEAGTYIMASAITNGDITLDNFPADMLGAPLDRLQQVGIEVVPLVGPTLPPTVGEIPDEAAATRAADAGDGREMSNSDAGLGGGAGGKPSSNGGGTATHAVPQVAQPAQSAMAGRVSFDPMLEPAIRQTVRIASARRLDPVQVVTQPYPGFPTDLQAQMMALLCFADGNSIITEKIYPDRFMHVAELLRMGAQLYRNGPSVLVTGVRELIGAPVMASDLRASAGLVLAGLAARGQTTVNRVYHLDRGYQNMELTLQELGADIDRVKGV